MVAEGPVQDVAGAQRIHGFDLRNLDLKPAAPVPCNNRPGAARDGDVRHAHAGKPFDGLVGISRLPRSYKAFAANGDG